MLLSLSPFESHQDLLSRGFTFGSFANEMSLPLDFDKQVPRQDVAQTILPPPAPAPKDATPTSNKRKRSAPTSDVRPTKRVAPTPPQKTLAGDNELVDPTSPESEKKRNKLGYHRTSVACSHCRRRKIRCMIPDNDTTGRCANCVRLKKDCTFCPVDDSTQSRRPQTSSGVSAPGVLPSPEPLIKGSVVAHSMSPAISSSQAREMMPASADAGLGIFGASQQGGDSSSVRTFVTGTDSRLATDDAHQWYAQIGGWGDKSQSNIFAATPLSAKSPHAQTSSYGIPSPYSMPSATASMYARPTASMTPQSDDIRSSASFHGDFTWSQPAGRSMSYMDNYAAHTGYAGAQSMMQPRRSMTLPSSTLAYPEAAITTLSMGEQGIMASSTAGQGMHWNTALWDQSNQNKDAYGQGHDAYAFDGQGNWYQGGSAPPF